MRVILLLTICCVSVHANCNSQSEETKLVREKMTRWGLMNKIFSATSKTSTYEIGVCSAPSSSLRDAAVIQHEKNETRVLGQLNQSGLVGADTWLLLTYENGTRDSNMCANNTRSTAIIFVCGQTLGSVTVVHEQCNYVFEFQVPALCASVPQASKRRSAGVNLLIILLILVSAYFIGGICYMRVKRGARGVDQVPNIDLWRQLGGLAADKCSCCRRWKTNAPRTGYLFNESAPDFRGDDDILEP